MMQKKTKKTYLYYINDNLSIYTFFLPQNRFALINDLIISQYTIDLKIKFYLFEINLCARI